MKLRTLIFFLVVCFLTSGIAAAQTSVTIDATKKGEPVSPYIYGQFIEHLGRCVYGGIWAEMLEDRKFYYSVNSKESPWKCLADGKSADVIMDKDAAFVGEHTPKLNIFENKPVRTFYQDGLAVEKNREYVGYAWLKCTAGVERITVDIMDPREAQLQKRSLNEKDFVVLPSNPGDYYKAEFKFRAEKSLDGARLEFRFFGEGAIYIGTVSLMPADNVHGMRADTLELLKQLDSPVYRWPGGNFVSGYDWNDGIGDRDRRPPRKNPAWKGVEHNDFGLDEFMLFCKLLKTEPYIAVNTGSGKVDNALAELEYANGAADSPQGKRRVENGHAEPYRVKFWGIGNEMYGDWQIGHMPVEEYAKKNNEFVDAFRKFDPNLVLVAVGDTGKWDEVIMRKCADHMDLISEHFYVADWNINKEWTVPEHVQSVPGHIKRIADAHRKYRAEFEELKGKDIRIALDEWNYWYGPHVFGELGTRYFVKDGLGIAAGLHEYFRNSDIYYMANYAQTVNVIGCIKTSKTGAQFETTGLPLMLYRKHFGTIPLDVASPKPLDIAAALTEDGKTLTVGIVNPLAEKRTVKLDVKNAVPGKVCKRFEINGKDPMDHNDPDAPQKIDIAEMDAAYDAEKGVTVAPYSVTVLKWELK